MKVNVNSWHWKMYESFYRLSAIRIKDGDKQLSFCKYFSCVVLIVSILGLISIGPISLLVAGLIANFWFTIQIIGGSIAWIIFYLSLILGINKICDYRYSRTPKEPSLVRSRIQAHKRKVCPYIEVVRGES